MVVAVVVTAFVIVAVVIFVGVLVECLDCLMRVGTKVVVVVMIIIVVVVI